MDASRTLGHYLSDAIPSSSTFKFQDDNNADESDSEIESGDEDEVQSSGESDSSSGGESENCPICLLKFKGQAIGFPEVCGHPFCLDCILEWTKNVQTCPNDRQQFNNILVRLQLDGEVVRKIPVQAQNKDEDNVLLDVTECQVCGNSEREDMMLLCDRCDQGYHLDCLVPALEEVPIEDWFCPRCNGPEAVAAPVRQRANLAMRVRRTVQRNRQIALRNSSVGRKKTRKVTKRKPTVKRKSTGKGKSTGKCKSTGKGKQAVGRKKRKVRRKGKGKRRKAASVPTQRKRIASALVQSDKSFGIQKEPASQFSLFGNPNALDEPDDDSDDEIRQLCSPKKETKSLIAKLAESRKVKKSIYDFGPVALPSAKPAKPIIATSSVTSANPDLLGSILASQAQLSEFGKPADAPRTKIRAPSNSSRVLAAILASRATLDRLDEDIARLQSSSQCKLVALPSKDVDRRNGKHHSSDQQGDQQSSSNSNNRKQSAGENSSNKQSNAAESNAQGSNGDYGTSGGSGGNGDDPNRNQKKNNDSGHKENDDDDKEDDVDLYSDIESVEEESDHQPDLAQNQQPSKAEQEDERMLEDDDEKGLVIDDTEESGRRSTESLSDDKSENADSRSTEKRSEQVENRKECVSAEGTPLAEANTVTKKATVEKSQHGGLPAAAAALSVGPRGGVVTRPQLRPRTTPASVHPMMNHLIKENLVSSIASALKESLTSALRAQAQSESLASSEDSLPMPSYSDTKDPPKVADDSSIAPVATGVTPKFIPSETKEPKSTSSKRKLKEIFGSDDDEDIAISKNQTDDLEQVSDCEEGELDESETGEPSDQDLPLSGNRIVRMLTPPPSTRQSVKKETKKGKAGQDCEEGEIVDKKRNRKPKQIEEPVAPVAAEDGDEDDILRSAGIGGERRVELISVDESLPSTFKKLDSGKTRRYRHQGEIKVVEGKGDVKVKEESTEGKRSKRSDMKHYSARRVVEQRSHGEQQTNSKTDRSQHRSRADTKPKEKEHSSKKVKSHRKRSVSGFSTSSSSSSSRSSSFSSLSSLSPERRGKGKENHHKRSRSSSTESSKRRKRKAKHRSRDAAEDTLRSRDKKKKSSKKKKKKAKSSKDRHKDKKVSSDGRADRTSEPDPNSGDIEIPSKAVFASGDKIVVSLHFGSSTPSVSKSSVKKKKRKLENKDHVSSKKMKTEESPCRSPSFQEERKKKSQSTSTANKSSSDRSNKKTQSTDVETEKTNPPSPNSSSSAPPVPKSTPPPPPPAIAKKEEVLKSNTASTTEHSPRRKESSANSSETPVAGRRDEGNIQGRGIQRGRGRGRGMLRSSRGGIRTKPVLIDIETSEVIPLEENRPSAVIVLSDSDHSEEDSKTSLDNLPPLPPLPPPPLPPPALCKPSPSLTEPVKPKVQLIRGVKGPLQKKPGAAVKFSLASKANTLKRLNNPLLQLAEAEEEYEEGQQQQQQQTSFAVSIDKSLIKTTEANLTAPETGKSNEDDNFLTNLPLPDGPVQPKDIRSSPLKMTMTSSGAKAPSPIFRPPTPPLPPPTSTYDPSFPTNSSSGSSSPSLPSSPLPVLAINKHLPPPPLPPPPTPPMMPSFSLLRPSVVLPPITSLPPPPLPPPPLLAGSSFLVHRPPGGLLGHYQHPTFPPPPIAGLHSGPPPPILPSPVKHQPHQNQGAVAKVPNVISQPPRSVVMQTPMKSGRPMTPPSPTPSDGSDIFGLSPDSPVSNHETNSRSLPPSSSKTRPSVTLPPTTVTSSNSSKFDSLLQGSNHQPKRVNRSPSKPTPSRSSKPSPMKTKPGNGVASTGSASGPLITQEGLEECPSSAVDLQVKEKFLKKLNRQERVVEEVRLALKPYYTTKRVSKGDYKEILRKCVPKICHTKSGEINPIKIKEMVKGYVKKFRYQKKKDDVVDAP